MSGAARRRAIRRAATLATLVVAGAGLSCAQRRVETPARHLILVTLDTLRADHVGVYGASVETPNLDRLAADCHPRQASGTTSRRRRSPRSRFSLK